MQKEDKEEEIVVNSAPVKKSHLGLILTIVGIFVILILLIAITIAMYYLLQPKATERNLEVDANIQQAIVYNESLCMLSLVDSINLTNIESLKFVFENWSYIAAEYKKDYEINTSDLEIDNFKAINTVNAEIEYYSILNPPINYTYNETGNETQPPEPPEPQQPPISCTPSKTCAYYYNLKQCGTGLSDGCVNSLSCNVCDSGFYCNVTTCLALPSCTSDANCTSLNGACKTGLCDLSTKQCYVNFSSERTVCSGGMCHDGNCVECIFKSDCEANETCADGVCFNENEAFSFMFMGDDNVRAGISTLRFAYTNYPDLEAIFWIPDLGGVSGRYNSAVTEWNKTHPGSPTPLFIGLGNHDTEVMANVNYTVEVLGPDLTKSLPGMKNFREGPYDTYPNGYKDTNLTYSFDYKNAHFIMMHTYFHDLLLNFSGACGSNGITNRFETGYGPVGCVSNDMLAWLENDLKNTNATFKFMFYHEGAHPVPGGRHTGDSLDCIYCPGNWVDRSWMNNTRPPMTEKFWSLLAKYNVTANFVGHAHHNTLTWANDLYGGNGAIYEIESGNPPKLAVVNIRGDNAALRLYNTYYTTQYVQFEPFGPFILNKDSVNHAPKLYQHNGGNEAGFPVVTKRNYELEVGQSLSTGSTLWFEAKDEDREDDLTFSFNNLPSFLAVNDPDIRYSYSAEWIKLYRRILLTSNKLTTEHIGNYSFDIRVSDGEFEDKININISILPEGYPVLLGASVPNGTTIQFPMNRDNIYFICYDGESGPNILRYNGYSVNYNGAPVGCCSLWHSYSSSTFSDKLAASNFFFPDDWDGIKDISPGRYDITAFCGDGAGHYSNNFTLTVFLSNTAPVSDVYGSWPTNGAKVTELNRISFWAASNIPGNLIEVKKDGSLFTDYYTVSSQYDGSLAWGTFDIIFNSPASNGTYNVNVNGSAFNFIVGTGSVQPPPPVTGNIYVDNSLSNDCTNYNIASRACGSGDKRAYNSLIEATAVAVAGDTVFIRGGTYNEIFKPANSGTVSKPITYQSYNNEGVVITGTAYDERLATHPDDPNLYYGPIWMDNVDYITIDGLNFTNTEGFGRVVRSDNNSFKNCNFYRTNAGWIIGLNLFESNGNRFENNLFKGASDNFRIIHSERNVIENNKFYLADHVLLTLKCSSNNIIRSNYFYNEVQKAVEIYDCEQPTMEDHYNIYCQSTSILNSAKHNVIENNEFAYTAPDDGDGPFNHIQYAGQNGIIRNNLFYDSHGIALGMTRYADEALYNTFNRVYNNIFYNNLGGGISTSRISPDNFDNVYKNNIFYKNYPGPVGWADNYPGGSQITHGGMANFLFENNNIINVTPGDADVVYDSYNHRITLATAQTNYPSLYKNNIEANPLFVNENNHDFHLQSGSAMINAGTFLTKTTGAGSGTTMQVSDAGYFYDGYGISGEVGDLIQLEGQTTTARVLDINYATNTLTLDRSLSWNAGQGVSSAYSGSKPDIGVYEYGVSGAAAQSEVSSLSIWSRIKSWFS